MTITVQKVMLSSPQGVKMTKAFLVPLWHDRGSTIAIGALTWWPPNAGTAPQLRSVGRLASVWAHRQLIPGAVIHRHQWLVLVFGLTQTTAKVGRSGGPLITYTADGNSYTLQENLGLRIGGDAPCTMSS